VTGLFLETPLQHGQCNYQQCPSIKKNKHTAHQNPIPTSPLKWTSTWASAHGLLYKNVHLLHTMKRTAALASYLHRGHLPSALE
jgi:hypothetical protein